MSYPTNEDRAGCAYQAVAGFAEATGLSPTEELDSAIGDLLANIMHLCKQEKIDFNLMLQNAQMHFREEVVEEETGDDGYTPPFKCANCDSEWEEFELKDIKHLSMRVMPGDTMPAGECPSCGALCYRAED